MAYFYSGQIRRFLGQFIRMISNFEVQLGQNRAGTRTLMRVPVYYGDSSRQVASIITRNTENSLASVPAMSVYISGIKYDRARVQEPFHVSKMQVRERAYDPVTEQYTSYQGNTLTVERLMPVPYMLNLKLDIWTSNTDQKLQLLEQLAVLFNPSLELQNTDSYVDWTSLSYITLTDIGFTTRTVPTGAEEPIDVATLSFELPIWLSAPAKVVRQGVVQSIIASVYDAQGSIDHDYNDFDLQSSFIATKRVYTPMDYNVVLSGNLLKLYVSDNQVAFNDSVVPAMRPGNWSVAISNFGELAGAAGNNTLLSNGISQIRLVNDGITVVGHVSYHPTDTSLLIFNVDQDTVPVNTLTAVTAIIDPQNLNITSNIANPGLGARYLIVNPIGSTVNSDGDLSTRDGAPIWYTANQPELVAEANDIIEYTANGWAVVFDSVTQSNVQFVTNLTTGIQYRWKNNQWTRSVEGRYGVGAWSIVL